MLFVIDKFGYEYTWHIGKKRPVVETPIHSVQADGDELQWIVSDISNIPLNRNKVQTWHAPWAPFIFDSIPYKEKK